MVSEMSVDYPALADAATGYADYRAAFTELSALTAPATRPLSGNELRMWAGQFDVDYLALKSASATSVAAEMAVLLVQGADSSLDVSELAVVAMLDGLVAAGAISGPAKTALFAMASEPVKVWPGLTIAQVKKAVEKRAKDEI
jgi:hypothetical protein